MEEVLPGVFHWHTLHPNIHVQVSSYWLDADGVAIDPLVPEREGLGWFAQRPQAPTAVLLSNRHHFRHAGRFAEHFGATVYCNRTGMHEFSDGREVVPFDIGAELPGGAVAHRFDAISPDDTALHIPAARAVVLADGVVRSTSDPDAPLGFVPDSLMDDPPGTKRAILAACKRLLAEADFENLLLAHGGPVLGDAREQLRDLIEAGGRTAFEF